MTGVVLALASALVGTSAAQGIRIEAASGSERELATKAQLERTLEAHDLARYTFTRQVVIEEGARNHAFPVLTLNARFADSPDELLASYVHEQLHWHVRRHEAQQRRAVSRLRRMYPNAPVGLPDAADTAYSTYGHLVTCYLEIRAIRELMGAERAAAVIGRKPHYLWIYRTVLRDEREIAAIVSSHGLGVD